MKTSYLLSLFLFVSVSVLALSNPYKIRTLSPKGGFTYDGVKHIEQDKYGFMWIVFDDELYRFDGYDYKRFDSYFTKLNPELTWVFKQVLSDSEGDVYISSNNGVYKYYTQENKIETLWEGNVVSMQIDPKGNLWIKEGTRWGVLNFDNKELDFINLANDKSMFIGEARCSYNDDYYVFSNYGVIYRYDFDNNSLIEITSLPDKETLIMKAYADKSVMWVVDSNKKLYKLDISTFSLIEQQQIELPDDNTTVRIYHFDRFGDLWIGTQRGLYQYSMVKKSLSVYQHSDSEAFTLPNNSVWTINEDRQGNLLIGTYAGSVAYLNLDERQVFETYLPVEKQLNYAPVSAFAEDDTDIWIGTEGGGINRMNKKSKSFSYFNKNSKDKALSSNNIKSIIIDNEKNAWIGTFRGGIDKYLPNTGQIVNYGVQKTKENSLLVSDIRKLVLDSKDGLWVAYQLKNICFSYLSFKDNQFKHFEFSDKLPNAYILDMLRGQGNSLWVLAKNKIYHFNTETEEIKALDFGEYNYLKFNSFRLDDKNNLWIGTVGSGIIKYDIRNEKLILLNKQIQHNNFTVFNMLFDENGVLWVGSNNGLYAYNPNDETMHHFNEFDGIQGRLFYPLASYKSVDNKLYFGGTNGMTVVNSNELIKSKFKPKVMISEFFIDNKPASAKFTIEDKNVTIKLKYTEENFGFRFSSDNYLNPAKTEFKFRLRGLDDRWVEVDASNRTAFYSKVSAGTYFFEILASNSDGVWSDTPTVLKIVRKPAPWASWYAYLLYLFIALLIARYIWKHFKNQKRLELQLYKENVEKEKKEEIYQSQMTFFTNISHDFRTPLTLILASLEKFRKEGLRESYFQTLNNNATRLLNLVNELMDFRTVEKNKMQLRLKKLDVNHELRRIADDFNDLALKKNIKFHVVCDKNLPSDLCVDPNIFEKIVLNLLNNAFKYTKEGGEITIESHTEPFKSKFAHSFLVKGEYQPENFFTISVRDNGVGISSETIETVFERYYKVKTNNLDFHLGTGVGLALVKSLIILHRGTITIHSERYKGTDMAIQFSADNSIYDEENFDHEDDIVEELENDEKQDELVAEIRLDDDGVPQKMKNKILFAEDNEELRRIIADYLSNDYDIIEAEDGLIATDLLSKKPVDLIISDIMMPNKDGITFCKEVKDDVNTSHIPFILLTAKTSVESKLEGSDIGADLYFEKPVSLELLQSNIDNIFKQRQQLKEYYAKNHYADSAELSSNERDREFIQELVEIIENNMHDSQMDVNFIAAEMKMSRSKLYRKLKTMTDMSIVEFALSYRLKKAARMLIEEDFSIREIMDVVGIESQPYFTNAFKREFGETPTSFRNKHRKKEDE